MFIIVMATDVSSDKDVDLLKNKLQTIENIQSWSIDLTDRQKILRVVSFMDISSELEKVLTMIKINSSVVSVFRTDLG